MAGPTASIWAGIGEDPERWEWSEEKDNPFNIKSHHQAEDWTHNMPLIKFAEDVSRSQQCQQFYYNYRKLVPKQA